MIFISCVSYTVLLALKVHLIYSLDGNIITDKGAGSLADALKVNQSLKNLRSVADQLGVYLGDIPL